MSLRFLFNSVSGVLEKGREEMARGARSSRLWLDLFQLKRDQAALYERLGREAFHLMEEGKLPMSAELTKPYRKLKELEARIRSLETGTGDSEGSSSS